jgi:hypothetical protein
MAATLLTINVYLFDMSNVQLFPLKLFRQKKYLLYFCLFTKQFEHDS